MKNPLKTLKPTECDCFICKSMCQRPCWGTPDDLEAIIEAGHGDRLMLDLWVDEDIKEEPIVLLCPANLGDEGGHIDFNPLGTCTFQNGEGHCELHKSGLKPTEGKLATHEINPEQQKNMVKLNKEIAKKWATKKGRDLVQRWKQEHMKKPN